MIFVTVGTHEQQFNRLIKEVDCLKEKGSIKEDVYIQTGYSDYKPKHCEWSNFIDFAEMENYISKSRIVITHGGPASFLSVLAKDTPLIVVPRKLEMGEHVNNHQLDFVKKINQHGYNIEYIENIKKLESSLNNIEKTNKFLSQNQAFNEKFIKIVKSLF
ncbi:glycosyltransferase [Desemzia sp. FAM 23989]|uniref:glycosyltransferase n=1 Tax=Desemzia sp. FAM 23989 TaxID=3259523 RepID=UPI00388641B0